MKREKENEIDPSEAQIERSSYYAAGFCKGWLSAFSHEQGIAELVLTERVAQLLSPIRREGFEHHVPNLRFQTRELAERLPEVEGVVRSRGKASRGKALRKSGITAKGKAKLRRMMKARWAAYHKAGKWPRMRKAQAA